MSLFSLSTMHHSFLYLWNKPENDSVFTIVSWFSWFPRFSWFPWLSWLSIFPIINKNDRFAIRLLSVYIEIDVIKADISLSLIHI